ncbi:hypothetical protein E4U54_001267 [Claviceps lovelessii]|nr:hypothetical protein E4U54_001267 [Claviceps lovelessii]
MPRAWALPGSSPVPCSKAVRVTLSVWLPPAGTYLDRDNKWDEQHGALHALLVLFSCCSRAVLVLSSCRSRAVLVRQKWCRRPETFKVPPCRLQILHQMVVVKSTNSAPNALKWFQRSIRLTLWRRNTSAGSHHCLGGGSGLVLLEEKTSSCNVEFGAAQAGQVTLYM